MKRAFSGRFAILFSTALMVASFQNCAKVSFESSLPGGVSLSSLGDKGTVQLASCDFNGKTVSSGDAEIAFRAATVPSGAVCESENRVCTNGILSGTFTESTCVVDQPASCSLRGVTVAHGDSIQSYLASSVPYGGTCQSQMRTCSNGVLSGTYGETTCAPVSPRNCAFNDMTILHGQAQMAYQSSRVAFGASCVSQSRVCSDGVLSGTYSAATCVVDQPRSCSIKGVTVPHGESVRAYLTSSVAFGESCQSQNRVCTNGTLSGAYGEVACEVGSPVNCTFNDMTVLHGQAQVAYQSARVAYGASCVSQNRVCSNGMLSGTYREATCVVDQPQSCTLKGVTVPHGGTIRAFAASSVAFGATCTGETRSCSNGVLSGTYGEVACSPVDPRSCSFNERTIAHGNGQVAYRTASVPYGATCESQNRICTDGTLSGTFTNSVCAVGLPAPCSLSGAQIPSGGVITAYETESVPFGSTCRSQPRSCLNGSLSGTFTKTSCEPLPPVSCSLDGRTVAHGAASDFFVSRTVPYGQTCIRTPRTCYSGVLNGATEARYASCEVSPAPPPPPAPVCEPALGCAGMAATVAAGGNPVIQYAGQSSTRSVSAVGQYSCQGPVTVTAVSNSFIGVANIVAAAIGNVSSVGATSVSLNANTVGNIGAMSVNGDLSVTTRDLGSITSFGSQRTCVSAQTIGTVTGNGGSDIFLYGRAEGGVRSTIQSLTNFAGNTAMVSNFEVRSPVSGNGNAALTFVNSTIPSFTMISNSLLLNASTVAGDISNAEMLGAGGLRITNGSRVNGTISNVATSSMRISGGSVVQKVGSGYSGAITLDGGFINEAAWDSDVTITCVNGGKVRRDSLPYGRRVPASCL